MSGGHRLDWRTQFEVLEPFANGKPGVIHVVMTDGSPSSAFTRVVRSYLATSHYAKPWRCVLISPDDPSTSYIEDIVFQISKVADAPLDLVTPTGSAVSVGRDLEAGGNIDIHDVDIHVHGFRRYTDDQLCRALVESLRRQLATHRIALIFNESHRYTRGQLDSIWSKLWDRRLSELVDLGLLVLDIADPLGRHPDCAWPPDATAQTKLPTHYGTQEELNAIEDLAKLAMAKGVHSNPEFAQVFAETLVQSSTDIRDLHARVGFRLAGL